FSGNVIDAFSSTRIGTYYSYAAGAWTLRNEPYFGAPETNRDVKAIYDSARGVTDLFLFVGGPGPPQSPILSLHRANGASVQTQTPDAPTFNAVPSGYYDSQAQPVVLFGTGTREFNQSVHAFWEYRVTPAAQSGACAVDGDCLGGTCVDGVCCEST